LIRALRKMSQSEHRPTVRAAIAIGKVVAHRNMEISGNNPLFRQICKDILNMDAESVKKGQPAFSGDLIDELIDEVCGLDLFSAFKGE
jgi:nitric oxide reductase NorQ protein